MTKHSSSVSRQWRCNIAHDSGHFIDVPNSKSLKFYAGPIVFIFDFLSVGWFRTGISSYAQYIYLHRCIQHISAGSRKGRCNIAHDSGHFIDVPNSKSLKFYAGPIVFIFLSFFWSWLLIADHLVF
jgi:hypothetical protein